jgi:hypothetical protein
MLQVSILILMSNRTYSVILSEAKDLAGRKDEILRSLRSLRMTTATRILLAFAKSV